MKNTILIVDDSALNIAALEHILHDDYDILTAREGRSCIKTARAEQPDLILLDIVMPGISGFEVLTDLKTNAHTQDIPVIIITALNQSEDEERGLQLGAADYISKPFSAAIVRLRVRNQIQIINQIRHIHEISTSDDLTGIGNRRFFCDQLDQEWNRAVRNRSRLSCMMIDINNFKRYNDLHGLLQGDRALKIVAQTVRSSLTRAVDKLARWGGDEFCVILPDTEPSGARSVAERIRKNVDMISIPLPDGSPSQTSVNIGVLSIFPTIKSGYVQMDLINDMEKALLQAKSTGQIFNIER